jgi:type I restriction enzyme, S subunit
VKREARPNEQKLISEHISHHVSKSDAAATKSSEIIERLRERRAALIAAAVTGQIDVTQPTLTEAAA